MLKNGLIRHASGSMSQPFIVGFYLYYIIGDEKGESNFAVVFYKFNSIVSVFSAGRCNEFWKWMGGSGSRASTRMEGGQHSAGSIADP